MTGLIYKTSDVDNHLFTGDADSDKGRALCRKSTCGCLLFYCICPLASKSSKQRIVAMSTVEAKLIAVVETFKEEKAMDQFFDETNITELPWTLSWLIYP